MTDNICKICGNLDSNRVFKGRDMSGKKDEFEYIECAACGCLQLKSIPENLEKYYADGYYAFIKPNCPKIGKTKLVLKRMRSGYYLGDKTIMGKLMARIAPSDMDYAWYRKAGVGVDSRILDIGSGAGDILTNLKSHGFSNILGIDAFIEDDIHYENGLAILKKNVYEIDGEYDFIMLHHSFEHMPDPLEILRRLHSLLKPDRYVLIRIPVARSYAWRKYGANWVGLDAPRHFFLHTVDSMRILARKSGFTITEIEYDSTPFQFWGSEQYSSDIAVNDPRSVKYGLENSIFTESDLQYFNNMTLELNEKGDGDAACFYLHKE